MEFPASHEVILTELPSGYDIHSSPWKPWPIEIDGEQLGLPTNSMVDLSMANCECHNQRVSLQNEFARFRYSETHGLAGPNRPSVRGNAFSTGSER